ncbi:MAG: amidohydrolase family protein [Elusimicrobiota bacterium]|mgnify:CR=1 FL=1
MRKILFVVILPLAGCASLRPGAPLAVIDAHTHTDFDDQPERTSGIPNTLDEYLGQLRKAGAVGAVAHAHDLEAGYVDLGVHNVAHCAGITESPDLDKLEAGLKEGRFKCVKVYLGYIYRYAADPMYEPVYRLAEKYHVPVVFHTGDTYSVKGKLKYADPLTVDEVAVDHPRVDFVLAHCGNPWIESAAEVAYKNPNVYLDGSAMLIGNLDEQPITDVDTYMVKSLAWVFGYVEDPKKLMFGSDWPLTDIPSAVAAFKKAIPKEHWRAVFHDNAARVFGIKDKAQAK